MPAGLPMLDVQQGPPVLRGEIRAAIATRTAPGIVGAMDVQKAHDLIALKSTQPTTEGTWGRAAWEAMKEERKGNQWNEDIGKKDVAQIKDKRTRIAIEKRIKDAAALNGFLDIVQLKTPAEQINRLAELKKAGVVPPGMGLVQLLDANAMLLARDAYFTQQLDFPDTASLAEKTNYIRDFILLNPDRAIVVQQGLKAQMMEVHKEIGAMPIEAQSDKQEIQDALDKALKLRDVGMKQCTELLKAKKAGVALTPAEKTLLESALMTADETQRKENVAKAVAEILTVPHAKVDGVAKYIANEKQAAVLVEANKQPLSVAKKAQNTAAIKTLRDENKKLTYLPPPPANNVDPLYAGYVNQFKDGESFIQGSQFDIAQKTFSEQGKQELQLRLKLAASADTEASMARQIAEDTVLENLDAVMGGAVIGLVEKQELALREGKIIEQKQQEEKAADQLKLDLVKLHKAQNSNWIEGDPQLKKDVVHLKNITDSMRMASYRGTDGVNAMMARDAGIITTVEYATLVSGTKTVEELFLEKGKADATFQGRIDALCTPENAKSYRDTLMVNYFTAQRYMKEGVLGHAIRWGRGIEIDDVDPAGVESKTRVRMDLKLSETQWNRLYENFEGDIGDALAKSKEAQAFIKQLEAQGVIGKGKLKILAYILMIILGLGMGGAGAAVALGGAPLAGVGVAAAGIAPALGGAAANAKFNQAGPILM